ncbi:unnamed protein product, partial [Ectocarpus sp. 12 AP-2014]
LVVSTRPSKYITFIKSARGRAQPCLKETSPKWKQNTIDTRHQQIDAANHSRNKSGVQPLLVEKLRSHAPQPPRPPRENLSFWSTMAQGGSDLKLDYINPATLFPAVAA